MGMRSPFRHSLNTSAIIRSCVNDLTISNIATCLFEKLGVWPLHVREQRHKITHSLMTWVTNWRIRHSNTGNLPKASQANLHGLTGVQCDGRHSLWPSPSSIQRGSEEYESREKDTSQ